VITFNVIDRVFHLKIADYFATGFEIDVDGKSYLITAKHFAKDIHSSAEIHIYTYGQWKPLNVKLVAHAPGEIDITVLALPVRLVDPNMVLLADAGGLAYGQDVYFLGYPYGLFGNVYGSPMPFVKKGIVSCMEHDQPGTEMNRLFIDGHNNPGFSGGPVVFQTNRTGPFKIASIISGYRFRNEPIYDGESEIPLTYRYNTGIILSYGIGHACKLARSNPIGAEDTL
jgi:Trypsin-like peptidase domain